MCRKPVLAALIAVLSLAVLPGAASASVTNTRITSGPSGTIFTDSATFAFTSPEDGGFQCRLDSSDDDGWHRCNSPKTYASLADGPHTFEVRALNSADHPDPTPAVAVFTVQTDTDPPETTIASGPSGSIATDSAIFGFESSEPGSFECRLDSSDEAAWESCNSPQSYAALADGSHSFDVRATDRAGNTDPTPAVADFAIDTTPPQTIIDSAPSGTIGVSSASVEFSATEAGSFECRLDSSDVAAWKSCSSPRGYASLADGSHSFEVRATDGLGNTDPTPAVADFAVYTGPPKPVAGQTLNLEPVEGTIELQCPGESAYSPLVGFKQVPVGCLINTRHGIVDLTASKGSSGDLQGAHFWGGVFVATQSEGDDQEVGLKLAGKHMCEKRDAKGRAVASISGAGNKGRQLWGSGKGNYTTSGSYGSATVRGTTWLVKDRCDAATVIKVAEGVVSVRDFVKEKTVTITAGQQYLAKSQIPRIGAEALP
jgi:hypothetical protein